MKNLNKVGKVLLNIVFCICVNMLLDKFIFHEKWDPYHWGGAIFRGVGTGLMLTYLSNRQKKRATLQSNSNRAR
jgi:hypothetical protein